jgi:hypothetical protein
MIALLKHQSSAEFHEQLVPVLEELDVPYTTISQFDRRGQVAARGARVAEPEPMAVDASGGAAAAVDTPQSEFVNFPRLRQLPFPLVVELLMQCMKNLPNTCPTSAAAPATVPPAEQAAAAAGSASSLQAGHVASVTGGGPAVVAQARDSSVQPGKRAKMESGAAITTATPLVSSERRHKPYTLVAVSLTDDARRRMSLGAFKRLLKLEGKMTEDGARQARDLLVARMAAMISNDEVLDELVGYIMQVRYSTLSACAMATVLWAMHTALLAPAVTLPMISQWWCLIVQSDSDPERSGQLGTSVAVPSVSRGFDGWNRCRS